MELAETICPYGEFAKNLRVRYLANAFNGSDEARNNMKQIAEYLFNYFKDGENAHE